MTHSKNNPKKGRGKGKGKAKAPSLLSLFPDFRSTKFRSAALRRTSSFLNQLKDAYLHRGLVLYTGAGVSRSLGLPSWPELIRALSVTMMSRKVHSAVDALEKLSDEKKLEHLSKLDDQVEKRADSDKPVLMMARAVKDELGSTLAASIAINLYRPVRGQLFRALAPLDPKFRRFGRHMELPSSPLLDSIVSLARSEREVKGVQAIVNYNYDDLLDEKLREQHVRCRTILSGRDSAPQGTLPCYHVHGLISARKFITNRGTISAQGNFVFSEDEYHAEYSDPYKWSNMTQMSLLGRYTGLFVGLSLEDPNIRRLVDVTHRQYPENVNYAILPRKRSLKRAGESGNAVLKNLFEEVETKSFEKIGIRILWVDDHDEIPVLLEQIYSGTSQPDIETARPT